MISRDCSEFIARRPRHEVADGDGFPARIERQPGRLPIAAEASLMNLSRTGFQLRSAVRLEIGERITVCLEEPQADFQLIFSGMVRWQQPESGQTWLVGCLSAEEASWETLGELFLRGILAAEPVGRLIRGPID
jgi:hypothetical protein